MFLGTQPPTKVALCGLTVKTNKKFLMITLQVILELQAKFQTTRLLLTFAIHFES